MMLAMQHANVATTAVDAALIDRADLLYCVARAFMPPPAGRSVCDWAQPLADDLVELGVALGLDTYDALAALSAECERWAAAARLADGSADSWLVEYSRLFLMPPVAVPLNTGLYLEGSLGGSSAQMMEQCYATAGFARREAFHDLPDHVGIQFEFVGALLERAAHGDADAAAMAGEFVAGFVRHWIDPLHAACVRAGDGHPAAQIYAALTDLARSALDAVDQ